MFQNFMQLPPELRHEVYEHALFDFPEANMMDLLSTYGVHKLVGTPSTAGVLQPTGTRDCDINTNLLSTSKQVYKEARYVIIVRGQLVRITHDWHDIVLAIQLHLVAKATNIPVFRTTNHMNFSVMTHSIQTHGNVFLRRLQHFTPRVASPIPFDFLLLRRDLDLFCRGLMGDCPYWMLPFIGFHHSLAFRNPFRGMTQSGDLNYFPGDKTQAKLLAPYEKYFNGQLHVHSTIGLPLHREYAEKVVAIARRKPNDVWNPDPYTFRKELKRLLEASETSLAREHDNGYLQYRLYRVYFDKAINMCSRVIKDRSWQIFAPNPKGGSENYRHSILDVLSLLLLRKISASVAFALDPDEAAPTVHGRYGRHQRHRRHRHQSWSLPQAASFKIHDLLRPYRMSRELRDVFDAADWVQSTEHIALTSYWLAKGLRIMHREHGERGMLLQLGYRLIKRAVALNRNLDIIREAANYVHMSEIYITRGLPGLEGVPDWDENELLQQVSPGWVL